MRHHIDGYRDSQDDNIVLTGFDQNTIGVGQPEPAFGHLGDLIIALADGVLVVEDIALHLQIRAVAHLDRPAIAQWGDQRLLDRGKGFAFGTFDGHGVPDGQQPLLDLAQLGAVHILEEERVAHAQHLAVDLEGAAAVLILDPEIVAEGNQLFSHLVAGGGSATAKNLAFFFSSLGSLLFYA
jgi:hypothetical protein